MASLAYPDYQGNQAPQGLQGKASAPDLWIWKDLGELGHSENLGLEDLQELWENLDQWGPRVKMVLLAFQV